MDNVLRCSIIFVMVLHIFCNKFGLASINPISNTNYNKVTQQEELLDSNERGNWDLPRLKSRYPPTIYDRYDFDDYDNDGEDLDSVQYSDENTQTMGNDFEENEESPLSADKRSRHVHRQNKRISGKFEDLCPTREEAYEIKEYYKEQGFKLFHDLRHDLRHDLQQKVCNHTTWRETDERHYNKVCYSLGKTFALGHGTHCFQRYIPRNIEIVSTINSERKRYTEAFFKYGCTCGWATDELGSINPYHNDTILNLCSQLSGWA